MTTKEKQALQSIADRINELANLTNADPSVARDYMTKSYLIWFRVCAEQIEDLVNNKSDDCIYYNR